MKSVLFKIYDFVLRLTHPILFDTKTATKVALTVCLEIGGSSSNSRFKPQGGNIQI
jgi:hypothetical protein